MTHTCHVPNALILETFQKRKLAGNYLARLHFYEHLPFLLQITLLSKNRTSNQRVKVETKLCHISLFVTRMLQIFIYLSTRQ